MSTAYPNRRRRPSVIRNLWVYRRVVFLAVVLGLMLWFIWANGDPVTVVFPFGLGRATSTTGKVILASATVGSVLTALGLSLFLAIRRSRAAADPDGPKPRADLAGLADDLPPPDYAKTTEGFTPSRRS